MLQFTVQVTNTGSVASDCAVLAFVNASTSASASTASTSSHLSAALRELCDFERIYLAPAQSANVTLHCPPAILASTDAAGVRAVRPGRYSIYLGGGGGREYGQAGRSTDIDTRRGGGGGGAVVQEVELVGEPVVLLDWGELRERHAANTNQ